MDTCPYKNIPDKAWWRQSVADADPNMVNPIGRTPFQLFSNDKIVTIGSCFAQNIACKLPQLGLAHFVLEAGPESLTEQQRAERQYGTYSARYGNVYVARQLLQLLKRAFGEFSPAEDYWVNDEGRYIDPFRPTIEPGGFSSLEELRWDRRNHLEAVRELILQSDVFIFTLGLTECWQDKRDGSVFPVCPGCGFGGVFDAGQHDFVNLSVGDVIDDLKAVVTFLLSHNSKIRIIFTVSPVSLIATMSGDHVLSSTIYSKSVLRVAVQETVQSYGNCCYFPAYEIITGPHSKGAYFKDDLRSVTSKGVEHVMRSFASMFLASEIAEGGKVSSNLTPAGIPDAAPIYETSLSQVICDEELLAQRYK